jgi:hypothetical protein
VSARNRHSPWFHEGRYEAECAEDESIEPDMLIHIHDRWDTQEDGNTLRMTRYRKAADGSEYVVEALEMQRTYLVDCW